MEWKNLTEVLDLYCDYILKETKDRMPSDWDIRNDIEFDVQVEGYIFTVVFKAPEYWKYAEYGRKPGKRPPVDSMISFVEKRNILPSGNQSISSLAFLIGRSIGKKGVKGKLFLEGATKVTEESFKTQIEDAIAKDISAELEKVLKITIL